MNWGHHRILNPVYKYLQNIFYRFYLLMYLGLTTTPHGHGRRPPAGRALVAALLGILLLGERLTLTSTLGMFLLFAGLVWMVVSPGKPRRRTPTVTKA